MRRIVYIALAVFLWALPLEPARAELDSVKFQGWMRNGSKQTITVQRVATQCWDPQQLAYHQIQDASLWAFASKSSGGNLNCTLTIGFISANVFDQNNNLMFWFQMFDHFSVTNCYIYLFYPGTTNVFGALPSTSCTSGETISFTIFVTGSDPPAVILPGLR